MAAGWEGRFRWAAGADAIRAEGACRLLAEPAGLTLFPDHGSPISWDWAEIPSLSLGDWEGTLHLAGGGALHLHRFAKNWGPLVQELREAWRERWVACRLLSRGEELGRFDARVQAEGPEPLAAAAQVRIYRDRLAVLVEGGPGFPIHFSDVRQATFDEPAHAFVVLGKEGRWVIGRLALQTSRFGRDLEEARIAWSEENARTVQDLLPGRAPAGFCEGGLLALEALAAADSRWPAVLARRVLGEEARPYFETLASRTPPAHSFVSYLLVEPREIGLDAPEAAEQEGRVPLFSFLFRLTGGEGKALWVWETAPGSGRATYLFADPGGPAETAAHRLNSALRRVLYRREPLYLPLDELRADPRKRAFAYALDLVPEVSWLRSLFRGRALHSSPAAWEAQLQEALKAL